MPPNTAIVPVLPVASSSSSSSSSTGEQKRAEQQRIRQPSRTLQGSCLVSYAVASSSLFAAISSADDSPTAASDDDTENSRLENNCNNNGAEVKKEKKEEDEKPMNKLYNSSSTSPRNSQVVFPVVCKRDIYIDRKKMPESKRMDNNKKRNSGSDVRKELRHRYAGRAAGAPVNTADSTTTSGAVASSSSTKARGKNAKSPKTKTKKKGVLPSYSIAASMIFQAMEKGGESNKRNTTTGLRQRLAGSPPVGQVNPSRLHNAPKENHRPPSMLITSPSAFNHAASISPLSIQSWESSPTSSLRPQGPATAGVIVPSTIDEGGEEEWNDQSVLVDAVHEERNVDEEEEGKEEVKISDVRDE